MDLLKEQAGWFVAGLSLGLIIGVIVGAYVL